MKIKIIGCDHPQYWYVDHVGETFDVSRVTDVDFVTAPDGNFVSKEHAEVVEEEHIKQASGMCSTKPLQRIQNFTMNHKDIEISFEDGMIKVRDWSGRGDPVEYTVDTIEQLEELMGAWEVICKFKVEE